RGRPPARAVPDHWPDRQWWSCRTPFFLKPRVDLAEYGLEVAEVALADEAGDVAARQRLGAHVHGAEHQDLDLRPHRPEPARQLQTALARHPVVDDGDVGL